MIRLPLPRAMHVDRELRRGETSARVLLIAHWRKRITPRKP